MNKTLSEAAARSRQATQFALGRWFKSKRLVVRRCSWKCEALSLAVMAAVVLVAVGRPAAAQGCVGTLGPCFQALGFLAPMATPPSSFPTAISPDGSVVVGESTNANGLDEAFSWTAGTMTGLGFPGCTDRCESVATGVNQQGIVVVDVTSGGSSVSYPYTWINGVATPLPLLPGGTTGSAGIGGQTNIIVGSGDPGAQAIVWQNGVPTALPPLSTSVPSSGAGGISGNGQVIVGSSSYDPNNPTYTKAVMWQGTTISPLEVLDTYTFVSAFAANADGSVIIGQAYTVIPRSLTSVRWVNGTASGLGELIPYATDATGFVVAGGTPSNAIPGAERWTTTDGEQSI